MVGGGVIISSIAVTISVPVRKGGRESKGEEEREREDGRGGKRGRGWESEGDEERERERGRGGGTGTKGVKRRR
jgi:hypothetical protein